MAEKLKSNDHQQEDRASHANALAERIKQAGHELTLKGEAIEVGSTIITSNGDGSFSIKGGESHTTTDQVLTHLGS